MIHWTKAGIVPSPKTVQIRITGSHLSALKAGAPMTQQILSPEAFLENLQYFRIGLDGPRSIPCTSLTLSGLPHDTVPYLSHLQTVKFDYVVAHIDHASVDWHMLHPFDQQIHRFAIPIQKEALESLYKIPTWALLKSTFILVLTSDLPDIFKEIQHSLPQWHSLVFSYPFPLGTQSSWSPQDCQNWLIQQQTFLQNLPYAPIIKGLPSCLMQSPFVLHSKTSNRWYVDNAHQQTQALLFFPDITCFYKDDQCRYCRFDQQCDGFFTEYLSRYHIMLNCITDSSDLFGEYLG